MVESKISSEKRDYLEELLFQLGSASDQATQPEISVSDAVKKLILDGLIEVGQTSDESQRQFAILVKEEQERV